MTPADRALLRFPGSVPGVLRRGSPITLLGGSSGVVTELGGDTDAWVARETWRDSYPISVIFLDLTDATGRVHLAWWLLYSGGWGDVSGQDVVVREVVSSFNRSVRGVGVYGRDSVGEWRSCAVVGHPGDVVPSLSTLDPNDPRLLPDGSRWVDAAALSLVARHVAGIGGGDA